MEALAQIPISFHVLDLMGVAVFAASGALAAVRKNMDLLGAVVLAAVTAVGGGTLRDLLLGRHPVFWMVDIIYVLVILGATAITLVVVHAKRPHEKAIAIADAFGLGLFTIGGAQVAERAGMTPLIVALLGTMTAVAGGAMRDVLSAEVPLVLRRDIYATASIAGGVTYLWVKSLGIPELQAVTAGVVVVVAIRLAAIKWNWRLPMATPRS